VSWLLNLVQDWQALHIVPPKTKFKEAKVHCPPKLQIGTLLLEGPKRSCTSSFVESMTYLQAFRARPNATQVRNIYKR